MGCTNCSVFSKIDLSQAYQQLPLDEESQKLVMINTQKGLFKYTRHLFCIGNPSEAHGEHIASDPGGDCLLR